MKKTQIASVIAIAFASSLVLVGEASATSVIDTTMKTALTSGYTDLLDTVKDVMNSGWGTLLSGAVLMATPKLVMRMIHLITGK